MIVYDIDQVRIQSVSAIFFLRVIHPEKDRSDESNIPELLWAWKDNFY